MDAFDRIRQSTESFDEAPPADFVSGPERDEPEYLVGLHRGLVEMASPTAARRQRPSLEQAREIVRDAILSYLLQDDPEEMLLVKAVPGVGKTTAAVFAAEVMAERGKRVLYAGPRHDFFQDILAMADRPEWWYEWLPRQEGGLPRQEGGLPRHEGDEDEGRPQTCRHAEKVTTWLTKGYRAIDFCQRVCGWDYVNEFCPYHAQKRCGKPIIFGQHQHVVLGHPLDFGVVIGDEYPVPAFCHRWEIPAPWVMPPGMDATQPLAEILYELQHEAESGTKIEGESLIKLLGGPEAVLGAVEDFAIPATASVLAPEIRYADEVDDAPYNHLPALVPLLEREAMNVLADRAYPHRIIVENQRLTLLLRHAPHAQLPRHTVWLDATANAHLYRAVFGRKAKIVDAQPKLQARIFQVTTRANGRTSLVDKDGNATHRVEQTEKQVREIIRRGGYQQPAVITYQNVIKASEVIGDLPHMHYYAARGSNAFEGSDAMIVTGTPQPPRAGIEYMARMVFFERDEAFRLAWTTRTMPYAYQDADGQGWGYPVSGFWGDDDLRELLWSLREAEVIQAAHRARPVNHPVDIWLLTNIPMEELPPDELLNIGDVLGAPDGVNVFVWPDVIRVAQRFDQENGLVTTTDLVDALGIDKRTARKYIRLLIEELGWNAEAASKGRGRPKLAARR